ncbi:putative inositol-3,4-bisphosphate 4-phosphatase [Phytophthora cinnamomi]|uniref:putative inositol-3,4-bisphosphate 4-phosphatase n=1 Tax=Phytophthora cinnamomi TaxID=4785 RepID=UPI00355A98F6|nr:putative inositol-3,4-bisphosphate 4-phosphatase [Phytophthora cinnamomi]
MADPQSPTLMFFDEPPASASSADSFDESSLALSQSLSLPPSSPVEMPAEPDRQALHFFVSCRGVDGNSLVSPARSAQTLVRGAFNMLSGAAAMNSNKSPRAKPPTEVNVELRVARETPIFGFGADLCVHQTPPLPPAAPSGGGLTIEMDNFGTLGDDKAALPADGLLDSESYWSERHKSRNPRFSVGFSVRCKNPAEYDRHVQIMVMIPDEGTSSNRNSQLFGYALTSFQEMFTVATSGNYKQKMTLPVHSTVLDGATVELQFANVQPQQHPLFKAQHNLFRSFAFYPLMREEHAEMQAANAKLAVEEAAEVDFSVKIPLQLLRVCQLELLQMYDDWRVRYNYSRKKNRYFDNDAEALNFGHDVFRAVLEKSTPRLMGSPVSDSNCYIPEDSSDFFYPPLEDENEAEVEDDVRSSDSGVSSDAAASSNPESPTAAASAGPVEPTPKKKASKYSMMARKAAAARAKALSKKRFIKKKSSRQIDQKNSDEKTAVYAKYPTLRTEPDEGVDPTTSINYAVRMLCRLEMLRTEYYLRKTVAVSQSVSSLVTCFMAELDLCLQERNDKVLDQMARVGFLIGWESLISSHGKELYMISDAWVAIKCLESFSFKLCERTDMEVVVEKNEDTGYIIKVPVPPAQFAILPESLQLGGLITVTSVLFTQGINEMQSLANMVGHSGVSIQRKINSTSFHTISEYYNRFTEVCGIGMSEVSVGSHPDEILRNLRVSVESENSASKNTCILLHAADAVRSLNGGRVTYCKSGKDRTAMSTTLEQARLLVQRKRHVLQEIESGGATEYGPLEEVKDVANTMRAFGVRIHIAKKNVGRFKYSFNSLQRHHRRDVQVRNARLGREELC